MADHRASTSYGSTASPSSQAVLEGVEAPDVDEPHERRYRVAPVRTVALSESFVEDAGGAFTRQGTPRLEVLAAARGAYVQRKADAAKSDALTYDSGVYTVREDGTHIKTVQGHAEDIWRRIYKRPVPEGDPLEDEAFSRFYRRVQKAVQRSDHLEDRGPAVEHPDKPVRDKHGKRWQLSGRLRKAERGREIDAPPDYIQCTDPPEEDTAGVWSCVERHIARDESLHREFTHAVTTRRIADPENEGEDRREFKYFTAKGRRFERRYSREGSEAPRYVSVGRWRPEAVGRDDRHRQPVRVPWLVAEIDGNGREHSDELARRLCRRLEEKGADLSGVLVSFSGNRSVHVRIPDGMIGCPLYRDSRTCRRKIRQFFRELCGEDRELYRHLDSALFSPNQLIRAIGTPHEKTGRRCVATTADRFLDKPPCYLWHLSERQFEYTPPERFPLPRRAGFVPALAALLHTEDSNPRETECLTEEVPSARGGRGREGVGGGRVVEAVRGGVAEGFRNTSAVYVAHEMFRECPTARVAWRMLRRWNQRNDPPLPKRELRGVFEKVVRWRRGRVP